jgi:hypothetical protein
MTITIALVLAVSATYLMAIGISGAGNNENAAFSFVSIHR